MEDTDNLFLKCNDCGFEERFGKFRAEEQFLEETGEILKCPKCGSIDNRGISPPTQY